MFHLLRVLSCAVRLVVRWLFASRDETFHRAFAAEIRTHCESLGPVFIKLLQILSLRPDFLPEVYCREFEGCLGGVVTVPWTIMRPYIERELGLSLDEVFDSIDPNSCKAASLGLVYRADLKGADVALKALHPDAPRLVMRDTRLLIWFARCVGLFLPHRDRVRVLDLARTVRTWLLEEINYLHERENMHALSCDLSGTPIRVPRVYNITSSTKLLCMEWVVGHTLLELMELQRRRKEHPVSRAAQAILEELIIHVGVGSLRRPHLHADPHPANIMITAEGQVYLLDCGLVHHFDRRTRHGIALFMLGMVFGNPRLLIEAAHITRAGFDERYDEAVALAALEPLCLAFASGNIKQMSLARFSAEVIKLCWGFGVAFPWSLTLYTRTAASLDGAGQTICPEFRFAPFAWKHLLHAFWCIKAEEVGEIPIIAASDLVLWLDKATRLP